MNRLGTIALVVLLFSSLVVARPASAATFGDAALTVSVATASGAILGISTLPFYAESGKHTKNIFYGAALGAVAGVLISAYTGVREGSNGDDDESAAALSRRERQEQFARSRSLLPEQSTALGPHGGKGEGDVLIWSPLAQLTF